MAGFMYLLVMDLLYCAPLLVFVWYSRRRIDARAAAALVAMGFLIATGFSLWRMEWFDVFRHGMPSLRFMMTTYGPFLVGYGLVGGFIGRALTARRRA